MWPETPETTRSFFAAEAEPPAAGASPSPEQPTPEEPAWSEPRPAWEEPRPSWEEPQAPTPATERYGADLPVAIAAAILGASVYLPWYRGPEGFGLDVSAWSTGTWGPVILFLAAGSFVLVALRRLNIAISLPIEESLLHEGAGWIALGGAVLKSRFRPGTEGLLGISYGLWAGIGAAVLLIVFAGRMSPHAPLVFRPGWLRGRAGKLGAAVLVMIVAGGATFGTINSDPLQPEASSPIEGRAPVQGRVPDCAKDLPLPRSVQPVQGFENPCQAQLAASSPSSEVIPAWRTALQQAGWLFNENEQGPGSTIFTLTKPRCGTLAVVGAQGGTVAVIAFGICPTTPPSPRPTTTPSS